MPSNGFTIGIKMRRSSSHMDEGCGFQSQLFMRLQLISIFLNSMFSLQNQCDGIIYRARKILSQLVWLQNSPLFPFTDKSNSFPQFSFQYNVRESPMTLLLCLIPASFSKVSHGGILCIFLELTKRPTIPSIE